MTLHEIRILDLGVIRSAHLEFGDGLTVITGETGAGKTMLLTALGLLLGGRADADTVRVGADRALVEGRLAIPPGDALDRALDTGAELDDDGTLLVARAVAAAGRSRAYLGGRSVPQTVLAQVADELVTVHGQSDQIRLRTPAHQRAALDAFAGTEHGAALEKYRTAWSRRQQLAAQHTELVERRRERQAEAELLRTALAEITAAELQVGEEDALRLEIARLTHAEELRDAAAAAHQDLAGSAGTSGGAGPDTSASAAVDRARRALSALADHDAKLAQLAQRTGEIGFLLADLGGDLASYLQDLSADAEGGSQRLAAAHDRLAVVSALLRRHGETSELVLKWAETATARVAELEQDDDRAGALADELAALDHELDDLSQQLTAGRKRAADQLAARVGAELAGLAMPDARLEVQITRAPRGPWGSDEVSLLLVPHVGAPARPISKSASGGELSRVMLAIEVALAAAQSKTPLTFIFDEVDAGVGGEAAIEVGRRLAVLARSCQVLVVTHLAQVAAFADQHLVVTKRSDQTQTATEVAAVTGEDRLRELARMLGGQADLEVARQHAAQLLAAAESVAAATEPGDTGHVPARALAASHGTIFADEA